MPDQDWSARLIHGDCIEALLGLDAESIDAVVCDPPYGLEFMGKDWDKFADRELVTRTGHDRADSGARINEAGFRNTLLPTFGGRLTSYECTVCGVRDAFRKGCRCDTPDWRAINPNGTAGAVAFQRFSQQWGEAVYRVLKPGGHVLAFGGPRTYHRLTAGLEDAGFEIRDSLHWIYGSGFPKSLDLGKAIDKAAGAEREVLGQVEGGGRMAGDPTYQSGDYGSGWHGVTITEPATDAAKKWDGWGTGLKPSHEPIVLARKPLAGTVTETVLEHGTGALNVRGCEVGSTGGTRQVIAKDGPTGRESTSYGASIGSAAGGNVSAGGRWPANLMLAHLAECEGSGATNTDVLCAPGCPVAELNEMSGAAGAAGRAAGPAREAGSENWSGSWQGTNAQAPFYDDVGGAARFFYIAKPKRRERIGGTIRNLHPTVKPIDLMRYLVRLVTPPDGIVLDPFLGSGTTGCAAMVEGIRFIGVELEQDSFETARARISDYAFAHGRARPS